MARKHARFQRLRLCQSQTCIQVCFRRIRPKPTPNFIQNFQRTELLRNGGDDCSADREVEAEIGNRIMVVVDSSFEGKGALEWALSHAVQSRDSIILVHVSKLSKQEGMVFDGRLDMKAYELLLSMKSMCQMRRPGVRVEMEFLQGKEMGPVIVEEAKKQRVSLLVLGQRKQSPFWSLVKKFRTSEKRNHGGIVEYCIQNSSCLTIAVRRKSKKLGGYLITTKRHKNFWHLA